MGHFVQAHLIGIPGFSGWVWVLLSTQRVPATASLQTRCCHLLQENSLGANGQKQ